MQKCTPILVSPASAPCAAHSSSLAGGHHGVVLHATGPSKKRFRTKFTTKQKERMREFAHCRGGASTSPMLPSSMPSAGRSASPAASSRGRSVGGAGGASKEGAAGPLVGLQRRELWGHRLGFADGGGGGAGIRIRARDGAGTTGFQGDGAVRGCRDGAWAEPAGLRRRGCRAAGGAAGWASPTAAAVVPASR
ncbi:hypothetical protein GUJ93_ZPchr1414g29146 [Zizania palustris]|uniref:Uncharacterized protein n=1 Tax=Zizania palustris TaxID=103762 RepID=A0A8J5RF90_ZIZPA|nr:hypothetical protein GUJ93_ZPchr1414g29146 [Zizania palustris]